VGLVVWHRAFLIGSGCVSVSLTRVATAMGFDRSTAHRALVALERAGLVLVERHAGCSPLITLVWPPRVARAPMAAEGANGQPAVILGEVARQPAGKTS
jgi:hypothetical protein